MLIYVLQIYFNIFQLKIVVREPNQEWAAQAWMPDSPCRVIIRDRAGEHSFYWETPSVPYLIGTAF